MTKWLRSDRRWNKFEVIFDVEHKRAEILEIEKRVAQPDFWNRQDEVQTILQTRRRLERDVELDSKLARDVADLGALMDLAAEGEDVVDELNTEIERLEQEIKQTEIRTLLSGEHDEANAIVSIHPGAGGTESQDWAEMLLRMYLRWAERSGYATEILDYQQGEEAGIKSATFLVKGDYAYGNLCAEIGVHRLVRISPFDAAARRHTSFASVFVYPEIDDKIDVQIDEKDLRIDTYRSSGAGGQHVNVTDSAVRITHIPTGIVVSCQNERSQIRNRDMARKVLRARLYDLELEKKRKELQAVEDTKMDIAWGSQIRSYVLHPYRMVKDHRTKFETSNTDRVLDGAIDDFVCQYLVFREKSKNRESKARLAR